ncbi:DUF262 domain-containing protein [Novosphingobium sp.]|mgnify:CR=1 FL=1|uniref:DUF262 domain-containing protein n=1 Tax=Novosphingobium sp. TaxID=1874826 RepID=UPI002FDE0E58
MTAFKTIDSEDLSIAKVFQSFYKVPDYQREYVWGEKDAEGKRGDEVEQFLQDIFGEFEQATKDDAPEYFIGTIVVCADKDGVLDLIDGQQRTTTSFLTLCALRDALAALGAETPATLSDQISSSSTDWQGDTVNRMRLDLQYEDAQGVMAEYGEGKGYDARKDGTRSIRNLANAYAAIREFLKDKFGDDAQAVRRFHGYFTNKVKLIRIQTPDVSRALKIFETINDRGVGLDAMDLLKNLLFMNAKADQFRKLKDEWKALTQTLYGAAEKPLRFLRYYILANFNVRDAKIREEEIYNWLVKTNDQTNHISDPLGFAVRLKEAALDYANFATLKNQQGHLENGLANTRALGGSAIKQHHILLLAGRHLTGERFTRLCNAIEEVMCVWLIAGVLTKDYERAIAQGTKALREVKTDADLDAFITSFVDGQKSLYHERFRQAVLTLKSWNVRQFRLKYLLAKFTQYFDIQAYGAAGKDQLGPYLVSKVEVEHILARGADEAAQAEFGDGAKDINLIESLGNFVLLEKAVNIVASNAAYSVKAAQYPNSQFLLTRCQTELMQVGVNDQITRAMKKLDPSPTWTAETIRKRQEWYADAALDVWGLRHVEPHVNYDDLIG